MRVQSAVEGSPLFFCYFSGPARLHRKILVSISIALRWHLAVAAISDPITLQITYWLAQEFGQHLREDRANETDPDSRAALERKWMLIFGTRNDLLQDFRTSD
jgi:hypothetical protein